MRGALDLGRCRFVFCCTVALAGCATSVPEEPAGTSRAALTETFTVRLGSGVSLLETALVADGELKIGDRVLIKNEAGAPVPISNSGTAFTKLGVSARVGTVRSQATIELANKARIEGDARSGAGVTLQSEAVVTGSTVLNTSLAPFTNETITTDFGAPSLGDIVLEPPSSPSTERVTTLAPGTYGKLIAKTGNRVNLSGGIYHVGELQVEPQARLVLSDADQAVRVNVKTTLLFKGKVQSVTGEHPAFRLVYVGTAPTVVEPPFSGTLIAPRASVRLASVTPPAQHVGSFFAKNLEVSPDVTVVFRPSFRYVATESWSTANTEYGGFSRGAALASGALLAAEKHAYRLDAAGNKTTYEPAGTDNPTVVDADSGRWGYRTATKTFRAFRPDGSLIRELPLEPESTPLFVLGAEKLLVLVGSTVREGNPYGAARIVDLASGASSQFAAANMEWGDASSTRFVYTTQTQLVAKNLSGAQLWASATPVRELRLSGDGSRLIGVRKKGNVVVNLDAASGAIISEYTLPAPLWELGASRTGKRTFAATQTELFVFKDGVFERRIKPPMAFFASAEVNDLGELVIGGKQANYETRLFVRGPAGTDPWQATGGVDDQGYRPFLFFQPDSNGFFAVRKGGAASFSIARRL
jgi:hypothetical protein